MQITGPNPSLALVSFLLSQGADPNTKTQEERPVIVQAKLKGLTEIVKLLLDKNVCNFYFILFLNFTFIFAHCAFLKAKDEEPTEEEKEIAKEQYQNDDEDGFVFTPSLISSPSPLSPLPLPLSPLLPLVFSFLFIFFWVFPSFLFTPPPLI